MRLAIVRLLALTALSFAAPAGAAPAARDARHERDIEARLAAIAPAAVPAFRAATLAVDAGRREEAVRLLEEVLSAAPGFTPAMRRLGVLRLEAGDETAGLSLLNRAVERERSADNLFTLARALAYPGHGRQSSGYARERALALAQEASRSSECAAECAVLEAAIAVDLQRTSALRGPVEVLLRRFPSEMPGHYFASILAAADGRWRTAERELLEAGRLGLPRAEVDRILDAGVRRRARIDAALGLVPGALLAWAAGLAGLFLVGRRLSAATLRSIEATDPSEVASPAQRSLRRHYRRLIGVAAVYYYVSLPFVVLLVVGATAAVFYGFMLIGRIPVQLVLVLTVGAVATVYKMIRSILTRTVHVDPGRPLASHEAPALWALAREVATAVGTRPIDEIRVTPGTEMAVYERGTARARARDEAHRVLILGVALIEGFRQPAFRAVLAHEYGHFAHRDTAGGDVALRVRQDMMRFAVAMVRGGQAVWWNLAFHFLRLYDFLFRRISHGATRLQEVLADRVAALHFGSAAFEEGLTHVIRRTAEFDMAAGQEIREALTEARPCRNLYTLPPPSGPELDAAVQDALARPATEDDTHPCPADRFRLVAPIRSHAAPPAQAPVWDLFTDPRSLTDEMTHAIEQEVRARHEPAA